MSLRVPLAVRLQTSRTDRHVTAQIHDLKFRSVVPGGFASIEMSFSKPLRVQPDEVEYYGHAYVYDGRSGETVCEGRLEDPGRGAGADGEVYALTAMGPSAHALDRTVPLIYVDTDLSAWQEARNDLAPGSTVQITDDPGGSGLQAVVCQFPTGLAVTTSSNAVARYRRMYEAGLRVARLSFAWDAGVTNASYDVAADVRLTPTGGNTQVVTVSMNVAGGTQAPVVTTNWTHPQDVVDVRLDSNTTATIANDTFWISFRNVVVRAILYDKSGSELTAAANYTTDTVLASAIVTDLLGRLLNRYDGANAVIATTSYAIDQLVYPDGVTASKVLDDMMAFEPGFYWAAWESNTAGKHRFVWQAWPTTVRYDADTFDGFDSPGSAGDLYDTVTVRWTDASGSKTATRTQTVPALAAAGISRTAFIDLGNEVGSLANANQAGDQFLAQHLSAPNAGRLVIARPIKDLVAGRYVMPWQIRPGELIRVRGVNPRLDALNASTRDGVTVFRIVAVDYEAAGNTATLELDSQPVTTAHTLAAIASNPALDRRRR